MRVEERIAPYAVATDPVVPLGEVCKTTSGGTPSRKNPDFFSGPIPWVKSGELPDGPVVEIEESISEEALRQSSAKLFPAGTLLMALYGATVGKLGILTRPAATNQAVCAIFPPPDLDTKFLFWFLRFKRSDLIAQAVGGAQPNISQGIVRDLQIPLLPLDQQKRIVAEIEKQFSRLDEAVANLKRVKANLKRYKAAVLKAAVEGRLVETEAERARREGRSYEPAIELLSKVVPTQTSKKRAGRLWGSGHVPALTEEERAHLPEGWDWVKVRDIGYTPEDAVQVGPMSMKSSEFTPAGVPILNVGCVQWGCFDETKLDHLPEHLAAHFERYRIQPGDVLFTRSGTVGRCAVAKDDQRDWLMTFHLLRVRPDPAKCLPHYLRAVFEGASHIRRQTREASIGSTRAGFNTNLLAMLDVPLPPLAEQRRILSEVDRRLSLIRKTEAQVDANLQRTDFFRRSMLAKAYSPMPATLSSRK